MAILETTRGEIEDLLFENDFAADRSHAALFPGDKDSAWTRNTNDGSIEIEFESVPSGMRVYRTNYSKDDVQVGTVENELVPSTQNLTNAARALLNRK